MSYYDFKCNRCGLLFDSADIFKPYSCPECGSTEFEDADLVEKREAENMAINKRDEELKEEKNSI